MLKKIALLALCFSFGSYCPTAAAEADHPELSEGDEAYSMENYAKAAELYRKDAELGVIVAEVNLAFMYLDGIGVQQSDEQAAKWFAKAAQQGNVEAQHNLGLLYQAGKGVVKDAVEADKWLLLGKAVKESAALEKTMTDAQIADAHRLAKAWQDAFNKARGR